MGAVHHPAPPPAAVPCPGRTASARITLTTESSGQHGRKSRYAYPPSDSRDTLTAVSAQESGPAPIPAPQLSGLRLDDLLAEVQGRLAEFAGTRDRMRGLLDGVLAVASGLELDTTLRRICSAAADLVDAKYAALGLLDDRGRLTDFIYVGIGPDGRARIPREPQGNGLL